MKKPMLLLIFILGAFRSSDGSSKDLDMLKRLRNHLVGANYEAFLSFDRDAVLGKAFASLPPRKKTLELVQLSDLNIFVFTKTGIRDGVVAELTEIQVRFPNLSEKHVVFVESGLQLSSIIDQSKGGIMSVPPVKTIDFDNEGELFDTASQVAYAFKEAKLEGYQA